MSVTEDPAFVAPANVDVKIWRYMDFAKFVSMLEEAGLFFARLDRLGDPFEGSSTRAEVARRREWWKGLGNPQQVRRAQEIVPQVLKWQRQWTYVSCWQMNEESAAMWKLYTRTEEAICVQSTYKRLRDCLNSSPSCKDDQVFIGEVQYIDFQENDSQSDEYTLLHAVTHKGKSFVHEQELRAVIWRVPRSKNGPVRLPVDPSSEDFPNDLPKDGVMITLDLEQLVERIYVTPSSPSWFRDLVEKVVLRHELDKEVRESDLDADPLY